ncbi:hypothetical protein [Bifidobacterium animalis]|uniref:hypothetical protein n=1 Tax=Bifidobacterium animalis TaxID=28025 RepID=UPI001020436E|nr:hypothetical protein [Bifidobacterium animalis]RYN04955.1 hypothetical protein PG1528B_1555 [Bifidobacterium animalis subsp. lactis]
MTISILTHRTPKLDSYIAGAERSVRYLEAEAARTREDWAEQLGIEEALKDTRAYLAELRSERGVCRILMENAMQEGRPMSENRARFTIHANELLQDTHGRFDPWEFHAKAMVLAGQLGLNDEEQHDAHHWASSLTEEETK